MTIIFFLVKIPKKPLPSFLRHFLSTPTSCGAAKHTVAPKSHLKCVELRMERNSFRSIYLHKFYPLRCVDISLRILIFWTFSQLVSLRSAGTSGFLGFLSKLPCVLVPPGLFFDLDLYTFNIFFFSNYSKSLLHFLRHFLSTLSSCGAAKHTVAPKSHLKCVELRMERNGCTQFQNKYSSLKFIPCFFRNDRYSSSKVMFLWCSSWFSI